MTLYKKVLLSSAVLMMISCAVENTDDTDQQEKTPGEVADSLGIHVNQIYNWRKQFNKLSKKQFQSLEGVDYSKEELTEIRRLKHENVVLREERNFLKKAVAYFADPKK